MKNVVPIFLLVFLVTNKYMNENNNKKLHFYQPDLALISLWTWHNDNAPQIGPLIKTSSWTSAWNVNIMFKSAAYYKISKMKFLCIRRPFYRWPK